MELIITQRKNKKSRLDWSIKTNTDENSELVLIDWNLLCINILYAV